MRGHTASSRYLSYGIIGLLVGSTVLLPWTQPVLAALARVGGAQAVPTARGALIGVLAVGAGAALTRYAAQAAPGRTALGMVRLVLHMWPVLVLTATYPAVSHRMAGHLVGGVPLPTFLLAVAVVVPMLNQGVCMPLYARLGPLLSAGDDGGAKGRAALYRRFVEVWPATFALSVPVQLLGVVPLYLWLHWSVPALGGFAVLTALDVLFGQALVLANLDESRVRWALAWTGYALPVVVAPTAWYLPPVLGLLTQVVPLGRHLWTRPVRVPVRDTAADVLRGLLLGSVMWVDKVFYFVVAGGRLPVTTVFLALLPAVVAYNCYFVCLTPRFVASLGDLRTAMQDQPMGTVARYSRAATRAMADSVRRTALLGAAFTSVVCWLMGTADPRSAALVAGIALASWLFTLVTVVSYKIDYIGERRPGQVVGAVHIGLCAVCFLALRPGPAVYFTLTAAEAVLLLAALLVCRRVWRAPEYTVFWRHAMAW